MLLKRTFIILFHVVEPKEQSQHFFNYVIFGCSDYDILIKHISISNEKVDATNFKYNIKYKSNRSTSKSYLAFW